MNGILAVFSTPALTVWLLLPLSLLILAGYSGWTRNERKVQHCWRLASRLLTASMVASAVLGLLLATGLWSAPGGLLEFGASLGLYPDALAVCMALMVGFIGWTILRYSNNYLNNDAARERFLPWFLTTLACVLILVFTNNLLVLAGAWIGVSLALHNLLTLYADREEARIAALQKFIISRIGDACVIGAVGLIYHVTGSVRLPEVFAASAVPGSIELEVASVLLALAALLKCAQVPFHSWLLRVMEAPTPVSALLHAGVVNLGGFLWLRLFPVFDGFTAGHGVLLMVGGITAVVAVLTMMSQASVKHALAWSTSSQMGFMLFEIGMGAYTLALLHLLAHSLYKAHSFLASGRVVRASNVPDFGRAGIATQVVWATAIAGTAVAILWQYPALIERNPVLGAVLVFAVAGAAMGIPAGASPLRRTGLGVLALALVPLYGVLHWLVGPVLPAYDSVVLPPSAVAAGVSLIAVLAGISLILVLAPGSGAARYLRVHIAHGFYLAIPFDRVARRLSAALGRKAVMTQSNAGVRSEAGESS